MIRKRKRHEDIIINETEEGTYTSELERGTQAIHTIETPTKPRRGRPPGSWQKQKHSSNSALSTATAGTPLRDKRTSLFSTHLGQATNVTRKSGAPILQNVDRSARRKSARTLIEPAADGERCEEESIENEDIGARKSWEVNGAESSGEHDEPEDEIESESPTPATPSKYKRSQRERTPTPPPNLPPHEQYFWQNRPGKVKISNNTLSSLSLPTHEQYHNQIAAYEDPHEISYDYLHAIHSRAFPQWRFELTQSFNLCLHGYGSKRKLVTAFGSYLYSLFPAEPPKILVANGYNLAFSPKILLTTLATLVFDCTPKSLPSKLGSQPREILTSISNHLRNASTPATSPYYIFINSLDATPLRRSNTPSILAKLAACPHVHLVVTCDTPDFPLLWSRALRDQYNFVFHDTTTFLSYADTEVPAVVDSVNELLGRSGRLVNGKEGVGFVLRSLPENARNLFRVLVAELLAAMDKGGEAGIGGGIEYKALYQKVVEEFICGNEMGFRQLLKEFYDHQMIVGKRDGTGTELLAVPFRKEEMEAILEDLLE